MPEIKLRVYGVVELTRRKYICLQLIGFVWLLALYAFWKFRGLENANVWLISHLDFVLLFLYLYGLGETVVVLRKFKRAAEGAEKSPKASAKPG